MKRLSLHVVNLTKKKEIYSTVIVVLRNAQGKFSLSEMFVIKV